MGAAPHDIAVSENGDVFVATDSGVSVIDAGTRKVTTVDVGGTPQRLARLYSDSVLVSVAGKKGEPGNVVVVSDFGVSPGFATGVAPGALARNDVTGKFYVAHAGGVTVYDPNATPQATNVAFPWSVPKELVVDSAVNKIYVTTSGVLSVIDGQTNVMDTVAYSSGIVVDNTFDSQNKKVYQVLAGYNGGTEVAVVGASGYKEPLLELPGDAGRIAVNGVTGKLFASTTGSAGSSSISIINAATRNKLAQIPVSSKPVAMAVDASRNLTYAPLSGGGVSVIDSSNTASVVRTGVQPVAVAIHDYTGTAYVANQGSASVTVIRPANPQPVKNDFNGDRNADVLARDGSGALWLYPGDGAAGWLDRRQIGQGWNVMTAMVTPGDFNGDGYSDVLARDTSGVLWLYGGNGAGGWLPRVQAGSGWNVMTAITGVCDFNGDGSIDLAARDSNGVLWLYPGNGKGGWLPRVQVGSGWSGMTDIVGVGDFNTDGAFDLMARDSGGRLWLYPGNGAGGWLPQVQYGQGWNGMTALFAVGDFSGDRKADIMARDSSGALWLFSGSGGAKWPIGSVIGQGWNGMTSIL